MKKLTSTKISYSCFLVVACLLATAAFSASSYSILQESVRWYTGQAGQVDDTKARQLLEEATLTADPLAIMWLARVYSTGRMGYPENKLKAQELAGSVIAQIEGLAEKSDAEAVFLLGTAWAEGLGKPLDSDRAALWYRKAAELGHVLAQHNMGNIYFSGTGVDQDDVAAMYWWRLAAEQGDAIPQYRLGNLYETGRTLTADLTMAIYWYEQSAKRKNPAAMAALTRLGNSDSSP